MLSETYAATTQREATRSPDEGWRYDYLGRLRLDLLAFRHVVLPDSHLFDGVVFLRSDPAVLLPAITRVTGGQPAPLIVKARAPSLDLALRQLLIRDDLLNGFPFKSLPDKRMASDLADILRRTPRERLDARLRSEGSASRGLAAFLRDLTRAVGLDAEEGIEQMEAGWERWIEAEGRGAVIVKRWDRPYDLPGSLARSYIDPADVAHVRPVFEQVWRLLRGESAYRGDVTALLRQASLEASDEERLELDLIESWARRARHWALAKQHNCSLRTRIQRRDASSRRFTTLVEASTREGNRPSDLPHDFIRRLGRLPDGDYQQAIDTGALAEWWSSRDRRQLERALNRVAEQVDASVPADRELSEELMEAIVEIPATVAGAVAGAAIGDIAGVGLGAAVGAVAGRLLTTYGRGAVESGPRRRVVRELVEYAAG